MESSIKVKAGKTASTERQIMPHWREEICQNLVLVLTFTDIVIHLTKTGVSFCLKFEDTVSHSRESMIVARGCDQSHCICSHIAEIKFCYSFLFFFIYSGTTGYEMGLFQFRWGLSFQLNHFENTLDTHPEVCCQWGFLLLYSGSKS